MSGIRSEILKGDSFVVTMTRVTPGTRADGDNLQSATKGVRDEIAAVLGVDDGDSRLTWVYSRRRGNPREYAVEIVIESKEKSE
jgi:hypothetical protein